MSINNNEPEKKEIKNEKSNAKIIDELPKNDIHKIKNIKTVYRLIFVFRNENNSIEVKPDSKIIRVIIKISKKINIPYEQLNIKYEDKLITEKDYDITIKKYFNFPKNKSRPILYVKIKSNNNSTDNINNLSNLNELGINKNNLYNKNNYTNKIKITNYPSLIDINVGANDDIYNIINSFLKELKINTDFTLERIEQEKNINKKKENENTENENNIDINEDMIIIYDIGFPTPDIAFDFKRYMTILKLTNPTFKDIKIQIITGTNKSNKKNKKNKLIESEEIKKSHYIGIYSNLEGTNPEEKNMEVIAKIRNNYIINQMNKMSNINIYKYGYLNAASPYSTPYEEIIKEKHENKKKWLSPKGFISAVNKYSGFNL
jgi:hypothetical protein